MNDSSSLAIADIPSAVQQLRESFNAGAMRSKESRVHHLKAFRRMMVEGKDALSEAVYEDLHKSSFEAYAMEINPVILEIDHMLHDLDSFMAYESVPTDLLNTPGQSRIYKDPLGVCCVMGAWNYPIHLVLLPAVGALAAGNTVLIKPGRYSQATSNCIARLCGKYMDPAVFKVVEGDRHFTAAVLKERFDYIFFTGGPFVGKIVAEAAAKYLTPTTLELGGKSPCIVDRTADLRVAADRIAWATFMNCGQTCVRPDYLLLHEDIADDFLVMYKASIRRFYSDSPKESEFFGRVVNARALKRLQGYLTDAQEYIALGGDVDVDELYMAPTVMDYGTDSKAFWGSAVMQDEIFGPISPVVRYRDLRLDVIDQINARDKPLGCYVFTTDSRVRDDLLLLTSSGALDVNDCVMHLSNPNLPFGGVGKSGMGSYHGKKSFDTFTHHKSVLLKTNYMDLPMRYPPYNEFKMSVYNFIMAVQRKQHLFAKLFRVVAVLCKLFGVYATVKFIQPYLQSFLGSLF